MGNNKSKSPIETAAADLRAIALATREGELLGSENELVEKLGVARITARQAARLLEREGVLRVRRGANGGYFAARPNVAMVEAIVCNYLDTLGVNPRHNGLVATALWVQVLREAAKADPTAARSLAKRLAEQIDGLGEATIEEISRVEREHRSAIVHLIDGGYIEVLFGINAAFARMKLSGRTDVEHRVDHEEFLRDWKKAKLLELDAIAAGDETLAVLAALHSRKLWQDLERRRI